MATFVYPAVPCHPEKKITHFLTRNYKIGIAFKHPFLSMYLVKKWKTYSR